MNDDILTCTYTPGIDAKAIPQLLILSIMAAEMRHGQDTQERDGRYRMNEKSRVPEIDTSTGFGMSMVHFLRVRIAEMFIEGEYLLSGSSAISPNRTIARRRRS